MSERVISGRLKKSKGKRAKIFLVNGFTYRGQILNSDEEWLEIQEEKIGAVKLLRIADIADMQIYGEETE